MQEWAWKKAKICTLESTKNVFARETFLQIQKF
jgi:hypothetical protein